MLPTPRSTQATAAIEEDDSGDSSLGTRQRSVEDEGKCPDAGGTREEGDVHQPPEVTQRVLADRVAVVDLRLEYVEDCDQGHTQQRPGNCEAGRPDEQVGPPGRSAEHPGRV